jgi:hypothetical protein
LLLLPIIDGGVIFTAAVAVDDTATDGGVDGATTVAVGTVRDGDDGRDDTNADGGGSSPIIDGVVDVDVAFDDNIALLDISTLFLLSSSTSH